MIRVSVRVACRGVGAAVAGDRGLDQRGHGESDRATSYERNDYIADVVAFHRHLGVGPVPVLGHSLGG
ncbi:alpha/beta fold hydrolase [Nonomuraea sp. NPDC050153]|uniref:alpha/beta fold hydrolase n=1 Tax=Nonomuraea sp. NPDC050153 TaxID=3364359 RepID=UPI0037BBCECA